MGGIETRRGDTIHSERPKRIGANVSRQQIPHGQLDEHSVHVALQALPGFIRSERLRGLSTPTLFADYITWASRAEAEAAAAQMPSMPVAGAFMAAIESIRTFTHVPMTTPTAGAGGL